MDTEYRGRESDNIPLITLTFTDSPLHDSAPCVLKLKHTPQGRTCNYLIDTGANANILRYSCLPTYYKTEIQPTNADVKGLASRVKVIGTCKLPYYINHRPIYHKTFIIDDNNTTLATDGIISRDFMARHGLRLRVNNDHILYEGELYPLRSYDDLLTEGRIHSDKTNKTTNNTINTAAHTQYPLMRLTLDDIPIKLSTSEVIPSSSFTYFSASLPQSLFGSYFFFPTKEYYKNKNLYCVPSVYHLDNEDKITLTVCNISNNR